MCEKPRLPLSRIAAASRMSLRSSAKQETRSKKQRWWATRLAVGPASSFPASCFSLRASCCGAAACLALALAGCSNNPYPPGETTRPILYRAMSDDPKTLDPSVSYTVSEGRIIDVIYSSYFRYHYLKRNPFVLELSLGAMQPLREPYFFTVREKGQPVTGAHPSGA